MFIISGEVYLFLLEEVVGHEGECSREQSSQILVNSIMIYDLSFPLF